MSELVRKYEDVIDILDELHAIRIEQREEGMGRFTTFELRTRVLVRVVLDFKENWIVCESKAKAAWIDLLPPFRGGVGDYKLLATELEKLCSSRMGV
jgi:hypothetical protein